MAEQAQGTETSEYKVAQQANFWGVIAIILGGVVSFGPQIVESLWGKDVNSAAYVIGGACLSIAGVAYKTLVSLGYIKSRTEVKTSSAGQDLPAIRTITK